MAELLTDDDIMASLEREPFVVSVPSGWLTGLWWRLQCRRGRHQWRRVEGWAQWSSGSGWALGHAKHLSWYPCMASRCKRCGVAAEPWVTYDNGAHVWRRPNGESVSGEAWGPGRA